MSHGRDLSAWRQESHMNPTKVLLIEDYPSDATLTGRVLMKNEKHGKFEVSVAASISRAGNLLSEQGYDVVLMDLDLPDSSGIDTLQQILHMRSGVPVIVLT